MKEESVGGWKIYEESDLKGDSLDVGESLVVL